MLPQVRNCSHDGLDAAHANRRDQSRNRPSRRVHLTPCVPGCELRMLDELRYGIDSSVRNLRTIEARDDFGCGEVPKYIQDYSIHSSPVLDPQLVRLKARVITQLRSFENDRAEGRPLAT